MTPLSEKLVDVGRLVLTFARVNRTCLHEDGVTPESDTDHTVMVSLCCCALAEKLYSDTLDLGLVAQFAIVHDLVEVYANDTDTFGVSDEGRQEKEKREQESLLRIENEFEAIYPWIPHMIKRYELLDTKEARFVKTVDKIMHKITHVLNKGAYFKARNMDAETMWNSYETRVRAYEHRYGAEFPEILALLDELMEQVRKEAYGV